MEKRNNDLAARLTRASTAAERVPPGPNKYTYASLLDGHGMKEAFAAHGITAEMLEAAANAIRATDYELWEGSSMEESAELASAIYLAMTKARADRGLKEGSE